LDTPVSENIMRTAKPLVMLIALMSLKAPQATAQGEAMGGWDVMAGFARQGVSDELASPLRHKGTGLFLGVGRASLGGVWIREFRISYAGASLGSSLESPRGGFEDAHHAEIGYAMLRRMARLAGGRLGLYLGGSLDVRLSIRTHRYDTYFGSRSENFGDLFAPLHLAGAWSLRLGGRGLLTHRLSIPLVSFVMRSPYTGLKYTPDPTLVGPTTLTGFESDLTYRVALTRSWTLGAFHRMTLLKYPDPLPLAWVVHRAGVKLEVGR
jgi:hypothetical protein